MTIFKRKKPDQIEALLSQLTTEVEEIKRIVKMIGVDTSQTFVRAYPEEFKKNYGGDDDKNN